MNMLFITAVIFYHTKLTNFYFLCLYFSIYFKTRQVRWKLYTCSILSCDFPEQFSFVTSYLYVQPAVLCAVKL